MEMGGTGQAVSDDTQGYHQPRHISGASRKGKAPTGNSPAPQQTYWNAIISFQ